ncbi:MAG: hypothetical protein ABJA37_14820 [Ferruginibacter sp.]
MMKHSAFKLVKKSGGNNLEKYLRSTSLTIAYEKKIFYLLYLPAKKY